MGRGGALLLLIMARLLDLLAVPLEDFNVPRLEDKVLRREDWRSSNVENPSSRVTPPSVKPASLACSKFIKKNIISKKKVFKREGIIYFMNIA